MYELMVIGNPKLEAERVLALVDKTLKDADATSVKVDKLGRKNLAFPIAKQLEGEYMVFNFEAEGDKIAAINSKLRLEQEAILRYFITKVLKLPPIREPQGSPRRFTLKGKQISQVEEKAVIGEATLKKSVAKVEVKEDKRPAKTKKVRRAVPKAVKVKGKGAS